MDHNLKLNLRKRDLFLAVSGLNLLYENYDNLKKFTDLPCRDEITGLQIEVYLLLNRIYDYLENSSDNSEK